MSMIYINDIYIYIYIYIMIVSWYFQAKISYFRYFFKISTFIIICTYFSNSCISNTNCPIP